MSIEQWLGVGTAIGGGLLTKEAYDRLSTVGNQSFAGATLDDGTVLPGAAQIATEGLGLSQFRPYTLTSSTGSSFGVNPTVDPTTGVVTGLNASTTLGAQEQAMQNEMLRRAGNNIFNNPQGVAETRFGAQAAIDRGNEQLTQNPYGILNQQLLAQGASDLGGMFMGQTGQGVGARETDVYNRMRAMQAPEEQRQQLALEERLYNQGRGGVQTNMYGGTPEQFALSKAQAEAQNQASLMAMQQAQAEQAQQASIGSQFAGLGSDLASAEGAMRDAQQKRAYESMGFGSQQYGAATGLASDQQALNMALLTGSYVPQANMLNQISATDMFPQLQQQAQQYGVGNYSEGMMSGIQARMAAETARANLLGQVGTGLLSGLTQPIANGNGGIGTVLGGILGGNSDVRLKTNIDKVATVNGINLYTWDWNEEGQKFSNNDMTFGVLAQEVAEVRPSAVFTDSNGYLMVDYSQIPEASSAVYLGGV